MENVWEYVLYGLVCLLGSVVGSVAMHYWLKRKGGALKSGPTAWHDATATFTVPEGPDVVYVGDDATIEIGDHRAIQCTVVAVREGECSLKVGE